MKDFPKSIRKRLGKPAIPFPVMYDVSIDDYRYVTQEDVVQLLAVAGAYGHIAQVVKEHSRNVERERQEVHQSARNLTSRPPATQQ